MREYDLKTLCAKAGVTSRTVHFYVQQGLLPPAGAPGPGARYGEGHVSRLRLIRLLQKQHLPLAEIARRFKGLSDEQVEALLAETAQRRPPSGESALEYIRGVLSGAPAGAAEWQARSSAPLSAGQATSGRAEPAAPLAGLALSSEIGAAHPSRSQWERFTLADGIELHVQRPLARLQQRKLDRLLSAAREIFQEDR